MGILFICGDKPELQEVVVAMLEMRTLPFVHTERAENGVCMHCVGVITAMGDESPDFIKQSGLCRSDVLEAERGRLFAEEGIFETVRRLPRIMEKSLRALEQAGRSMTGNDERTCRALKRPEQVLHHMLSSHVSPLCRGVLAESLDCVRQMPFVERLSKHGVVDVKGDGDHLA